VSASRLHRVHVGGSDDLVNGGINLVEIRRADETLNHRDMRTVGRIQGKTFRIGGQQACIVSLRMLEHRGIRLQQYVDGCDRVFLRIRRR